MVIDDFGGADKLRMAEIPTPVAGSGEVLVKIACAGVNPVDWKIREGMLEGLFPHAFPLILGWDAAGIVAALGSGVSDFAVGDKVYAYCRKPNVQWGSYAEFIVLPAGHVAPMPANLSFAEAASIPLVSLTSWQSLFDVGGLQAGQSALIHAGAGGTGGIAIQFAKHAGALIFSTASAANRDYVLGLGADHVIDYQSEDFVDAIKNVEPAGVDLAYVTASGVIEESLRAVRRGGRLVSIVEQPDAEVARQRGVEAAFHFVEPSGAQLRKIAALIEAGSVKPLAIQEVPLEEVGKAHSKSEAGHVRGKIILRVATD
jgi:NADPH2:quinone reductase